MRKIITLLIAAVLLASFALAATKDPFAAALKSGKPIIAKLGAEWCPPCREMKPILKDLSTEFKGKIIILDLDIEKYRDLSKQFKVNLIPTTLFYNKNGKFVYKNTGFMSKDAILQKIKELSLLK